MHITRIALSLVAMASLAFLPGCGWFIVGGVAGVVDYLNKMDAEVTNITEVTIDANSPPSAIVIAPRADETTGGRVFFEYKLVDAEANACDVVVEYSEDDGQTWAAATEISVTPSAGTTGLAASALGTTHVFTWNAMADLGVRNVPANPSDPATVRLRLTPTDDEGDEGPLVASFAFRVNNSYVNTVAGGELAYSEAFLPEGVSWAPAITGKNERLLVTHDGKVSELDLVTGEFTQIAGTGYAGFNADNCSGLDANFTYPGRAVPGPNGQIFVPDAFAHRIRAIDPDTGFITTIVGTGVAGYGGEGTALSATLLNFPIAVAYDPSRNLLWISENGNHCIRAANLGATSQSIAGICIKPGTVSTIIGTPGMMGLREGRAGLSGDVGRYASLKVDGSGRPCVAYWDETNGILLFARKTGLNWHIETVDQGEVGSHCSLTLDSSDHPHISYRDQKNDCLRYAWHDGTSWVIETVDNSDGGGGYSSVGLDGSGNPVISHVLLDGGQMRIAWKSGGTWQTSFLPWIGVEDTSLAVDSLGRPHVAFFDASAGNLNHVYHDGSNWTSLGGPSTIVSAGTVGRYCSLAIDGSNNPHIAYFDADTNGGDVMYIRWNGSSWLSPASVDGQAGPAGTHCSLALTSLDRPVISYVRAGPDRLCLAADLNGNGSFVDAGEQVNVAGGNLFEQVGRWSCVALNGDRPCVAYAHDSVLTLTGQSLQFADLEPDLSAVKSECADSGLCALITKGGRFEDLILDPSGNVLFSCQSGVKFLNVGNSPVRFGEVWIPPGEVRIVAGLSSSAPSISYDSSASELHMVAHAIRSEGLIMASRSLSSQKWDRTFMTGGSFGQGWFPDTAVDGAGNLHLAYVNLTTRNLCYAVRNGSGTWTHEDPFGGAAHTVIDAPSIAIDGLGNPAIVCFDRDLGALRFLQRGATAWAAAQPVGTPAFDAPHMSLAFDGLGGAGVAYYNQTAGDLVYAYYNGSSWSVTQVDTPGNVGDWPSLAFDSSNNPAITYIDVDRHALKAAAYSAGWNFMVIDAYAQADGPTKLNYDIVSGLPWVTYGNINRSHVFLSTFDGSTWTRRGFPDRFERDWTQDGSGNIYVVDGLLNASTVFGATFSNDLTSFTSTWVLPYELVAWFGDGRNSVYRMPMVTPSGLALARWGNYGSSPPEYDVLIESKESEQRIRALNLSDPRSGSGTFISVAGRTLAPGEGRTILGTGEVAFDPTDDGRVLEHLTNPVELTLPYDVATDDQGNLFFTDAGNFRIRVFNTGPTPRNFAGRSVPAGATQTILGGQLSTADLETLYRPGGACVDPETGSVFVTDWAGYLYEVNPVTGQQERIAGNGKMGFSGDGGPAGSASLNTPRFIAIDREGNLYFCSEMNRRIRVVNRMNADGYVLCGKTFDQGGIDTVLGTDVVTGSIDGPGGDPSDDLGDGGLCGSATISYPTGLAVDRRPFIGSDANPRGVLFVGDRGNSRVRAVNLNPTGQVTVCGVTIPAGCVETVLGTGIARWTIDGPGGNPLDDAVPGSDPLSFSVVEPAGVCVDGTGMLIVGSYSQILAVNTDAVSQNTLCSITVDPNSVEILAGTVWRTSFNGDDIPAIGAGIESNNYLAVWREGTGPGEKQELYICDSENYRIRMVDETGTIDTFIGNGSIGYNGDGVPLENTLLGDPLGICVHDTGTQRTVYFVDNLNARLRRVVK